MTAILNNAKQILVRAAHSMQVVWWFLTRPKTMGVKCLVVQDAQVLLVRPSYAHKSWTLPGGRVGRNEKPEEAARRELREEVGLTASSLSFLGTYNQQIEYKDDTVHCFLMEVEDFAVSIDNAEIVEYGWADLDALPAGTRPSVTKILKMYAQR